jgi:hypothetical protein
MPIIILCIHLLRRLLLKYVWGTFLAHVWNLFLEKQVKKMEKMIQINLKGAFIEFNSYIKQYKNNWIRAKPSIRQCMTNIRLIISFKLVIKYGYISTKIE